MWATKSPAIKAGPAVLWPQELGHIQQGGRYGRGGAPTASSHTHFDSFSLPAADLETGKALAETLQKVKEQTGAIVESSVQMKTGLKTFLIKATDQKRLAYARKLIERGLSKVGTIDVEVPISTLGTIIGPKGATLKSITESTGCKIDIPRRDALLRGTQRTPTTTMPTRTMTRSQRSRSLRSRSLARLSHARTPRPRFLA